MFKAYHLSTIRNEWANWNGDHHKVRRGNPKVFLTLGEAESRAESLRTPGSYFQIREQPVIAISLEGRAYGLTEVFSDTPLLAIAQHLESGIVLSDIFSAIEKLKWGVPILLDQPVISEVDHNPFFERTSSPGKGKNSLGWSLKPIKYNLKYMNAVVDHLELNICKVTNT